MDYRNYIHLSTTEIKIKIDQAEQRYFESQTDSNWTRVACLYEALQFKELNK